MEPYEYSTRQNRLRTRCHPKKKKKKKKEKEKRMKTEATPLTVPSRLVGEPKWAVGKV
jgi:hypothetical protein